MRRCSAQLANEAKADPTQLLIYLPGDFMIFVERSGHTWKRSGFRLILWRLFSTTVPEALKASPASTPGGELIYARRKALVAWSRYLSLLLDDRIAKRLQTLLNPESEIDAEATDSFRQLLLADVTTWERRRHSMFRLAT